MSSKLDLPFPLRPYQEEGVDFLESNDIALLGDDMLGNLRAMYSDLEEQLQAAEVAESVKNELRSRIAALNPDSWLAGEEVIRRIEQFESEVAAIQVLLTDR